MRIAALALFLAVSTVTVQMVDQGDPRRSAALAVLENGQPVQRRDALRFLLDNANTEAEMQKVEHALSVRLKLTEEDGNLVRAYARRRGTKAKKLADNFISRLKASSNYPLRLRPLPVWLGQLTAGPDLDTRVDGLLSGGGKTDFSRDEAFMRTLKDQAPGGNSSRFLLETALRTDDLALRLKFIECIEPHQKLAPSFSSLAALWRPLLAEPKADENHRERLRSLIVSRYAGQEWSELNGLVASCRRLHERVQELGEAVIDEKLHLDSVRLADLAGRLAKVEPKDLEAFSDRLPVAELLALDEVLGQDKQLNAKFLSYANIIREVYVAPELRDKEAGWKSLKGTQLTPLVWTRLLKDVQDAPHERTYGHITRHGCLRGVSLTLGESGTSEPISRQENGFSLLVVLQTNEQDYRSCLRYRQIVAKGGTIALDSAKVVKSGFPPELFWRHVEATFMDGPAIAFVDLRLAWNKTKLELLPPPTVVH